MVSTRRTERPVQPLSLKQFSTLQEILTLNYGTSFTDTEYTQFLMHQKEHKVFLLSKELAQYPINLIRVNSQGLYIGEFNETFSAFRLSIEGSQLIGQNATQHIFELTHTQLSQWAKGERLKLEGQEFADHTYVIVSYKGDFYGVGVAKNGELHNFVPKTRRLKTLATAQTE